MPTRSEVLVLRLCTASFMSLWCYASPRRDDGKELCDVLVVCDPHVVIVSVKEVQGKDTGRPAVDWERWTREAINKSADQVFGAERQLRSQKHVVRNDGSQGLVLPLTDRRQVHRVVVALGSGGTIPMAIPKFAGGHVHVFDERSLDVLMGELDTITDFTEYLRAKSEFVERTRLLVSGEEDLLALYLNNGRVFPQGHDFAFLEEGLWNAFAAKEAVRARDEANRASRVFDEIITRFMRELEQGTLEPGSDPSMTEQMLRVMAMESRFNRRVLGEAFGGLMLKAASRPEGLTRRVVSPSGVTYVFVAMPRSVDREARQADLRHRTFVARGLNRDGTTAIGIATERLDGTSGVSLDGCLVHVEEWTPRHQRELEEIQRLFGIFVAPEMIKHSVDEYPDVERTS